MKRIILIMAVGVTILGASSCKKDWTCQCTDNLNVTTYEEINNATLTDAGQTCSDLEYNNGATYKNCSIIQ
jgi:hypothetical protein